LVNTTSLSAVASSVLDGVIRGGGWAFVLAASGFVVFALWLALSRYGRIPLGRDGERPEFRTVSWVAMMFSAGMGIGLMFYGVAEPLAHFTDPPPGTVAAGTDAAFDVAMATTLFHWSVHPWAIYAVVGLSIAYSTFRAGRRSLISSAFEPLLGARRCAGPLGRAIDVMAIFATLFGSAASLGLGALQIGGRAAGGRLPGRSAHRAARGRHRRAHDRVRRLRGERRRQGHPVAVEHQHGARRGARGVRVRGRADDPHPQPAAHHDRRLLRRPRA